MRSIRGLRGETVKYTVRLKENSAFRRAYHRGKSAVSPLCVLYARRNGSAQNRVGFVVSVKLGHAVVRNRVKRRFREIYRLHEASFRPGYDLVLVARSRAVGADFAALTKEVLRLAEKVGVLV